MSFLLWIALFAMSSLAPQGQGGIEGTVAKAGAATPIPAARIRLRILDPNNSDLLISRGLAGGNVESSHDSGLRTISETTTDAAGRFAFRDVPAGSFTIEASAEGYVADTDSQPTVSAGVIVTEGQRAQTPPLALMPASTILGRVVDSKNQPVPGAGVWVMELTTMEDGREWLRPEGSRGTAPTDAAGLYRIPNLAPGEYYVRAIVDFEDVYFPGVFDLADSVRVVTLGDAQAIADIRIPPPREGPTFKISGSVTLPGGAPATETDYSGAQVWLEDRNSSHRVRTSGQQPGDDIRLSEDGRFELAGVRVGNYKLFVQTGETPSPALFSSVPIDIQDKDVENMVVVLQPGVEIKGRVVVRGDPTSFEFLDDSVDSVHISLFSRNGFGPNSFHAKRTTRDDRVSFAFSNVPEGIYEVVVHIHSDVLSFYPDAYVEDIRVAGMILYDRMLQVGTSPMDSMEVVIGTSGGSIEGAITSRGKDSPAMLILAPDRPRRGNAALYRRLALPESGEFRLGGIAPGTYTIFAVPGSDGTVPFRSLDFIARHEFLALSITVRNGVSVTGITVPYIASAP